MLRPRALPSFKDCATALCSLNNTNLKISELQKKIKEKVLSGRLSQDTVNANDVAELLLLLWLRLRSWRTQHSHQVKTMPMLLLLILLQQLQMPLRTNQVKTPPILLLVLLVLPQLGQVLTIPPSYYWASL